ncbi:CBN-UBC-6 protein [Aphelenchoides avenae]|nr:CBN-UBC-6 protein [Aphelenchus avenae]
MELNYRCAGVKRLMKEAAELSEPTDLFCAHPLEDNLFEWHFTVRGPPDTDFADGVYHGRIILPTEYPMKPPNLVLLTPNGRFETNKKVCLSISGYHPETWLPSWSIRTALLALIGFMPSAAAGAVGALECSSEERKKLAKKSLDWRCETCGCVMRDVLEGFVNSSTSAKDSLRDMSASLESSSSANSEAPSTASAKTNLENAISKPEAVPTTTPSSSITVNASNEDTSRARLAANIMQSMATTQRLTPTPTAVSSRGHLEFLRSPGFWLMVLSGVLFGLVIRRALM